MSVRSALFLVPAALLLIPASGFAQIPSPAPAPEVDQALRARVTEFFQDFVDGKFRLAINLVAEDTQDEYFSSPKAEIKSFKIDAIDFSSDFAKATVHMTVKQVWKLKAEGFMQDQIVESPMSTTWKVENGKWVFYHQIQPDGWVTPMGPSAGFHKPDGTTGIPAKLDDATLTTEADRVLHQTSVDKSQVLIAANQPSSTKVTFHNGAQGSVNVSLVGLPKVEGLTVTLDKQWVEAGKDAVLEFNYAPVAGLQPHAFTVAIEVAPFNQDYPVQVDFGAAPK
ncbi:MAG TPA: hypothetical protein VGG72_30260 [Bryobacteraceae bacterium]|jgi:hypothetical protein